MNVVSLLVTILIIALVFSLAWWILGQMPLPEPFRLVANIVLGIICIVVLLGMLTGTVNVPMLRL